jgi:hypothetical protein
MKIRVPENISDITLDQYQRYHKLSERTDIDELNFNKRLVEIFCGISYHDSSKINAKDYLEIIEMVKFAIGQDSEFVQRFEMNGLEFGFIPNLNDMTFDEYRALSNFGVEVDNLHLLMSVLFRPVTNTDAFGNYSIMPYTGIKEYSDVMKQTPMNVVNGALVFFLNLSRELNSHIQKCIAQEQVRVNKRATISENGIGMQLGTS